MGDRTYCLACRRVLLDGDGMHCAACLPTAPPPPHFGIGTIRRWLLNEAEMWRERYRAYPSEPTTMHHDNYMTRAEELERLAATLHETQSLRAPANRWPVPRETRAERRERRLRFVADWYRKDNKALARENDELWTQLETNHEPHAAVVIYAGIVALGEWAAQCARSVRVKCPTCRCMRRVWPPPGPCMCCADDFHLEPEEYP